MLAQVKGIIQTEIFIDDASRDFSLFLLLKQNMRQYAGTAEDWSKQADIYFKKLRSNLG